MTVQISYNLYYRILIYSFILVAVAFQLAIPTSALDISYDNTQSIFVSTTGSDNNPGTFEKPFKTIQKGIDSLLPGKTLYIRGGTYYENLDFTTSGSKSHGYITLSPYKSEEVILDGSKSNGDSMIYISNKSYIIVKGITIANNIGQYSSGVMISNGSRHIEINGLKIHNISTDIDASLSDEGNANPILVISKLSKKPNYDIRILYNHIYDCKVGHSEALTITQNTDNFIVKGNLIHDITNIGIDIAGHYGEFDGDDGLNQARNGTISDNVVYNCKSQYGGGAASGLYVDGGRDLLIERNIVYSNDYGVTIGCETPNKSTSNIVVKNNIVYNNDKSGMSIGGYSEKVGVVEDSGLYNNLLFSNNVLEKSSHGEISINKTKGKIEIFNNVLYQDRIRKELNESNTPIVQYRFKNPDINMDYNMYLSNLPSKNSIFSIKDDYVEGFNNFKILTRFDYNSIYINPGLTLSFDHVLKNSSDTPIIDLSNPYHQYKGDTDFSLTERSLNIIWNSKFHIYGR